jgi:hypothetical protein
VKPKPSGADIEPKRHPFDNAWFFDRYNIVSEDHLRTAVKKTNAYLRTAPKLQSVTIFPARKKAAAK